LRLREQRGSRGQQTLVVLLIELHLQVADLGRHGLQLIGNVLRSIRTGGGDGCFDVGDGLLGRFHLVGAAGEQRGGHDEREKSCKNGLELHR
jgi:hypothetical protein